MATSRLDEIRMIDPVLTTIAQGYSNPGLVADFLFPHVQVSKLKGKVPAFGKDAFIVRDTARAIRAASNRIPPSDISFVEFETNEKDIEVALDYLEEEEALSYQLFEQRITKELMDILMLGKEKESADLAQNAANYAAGQKKVITALNAWDDYTIATVDPIADIQDGMKSIRQLIGKYPNTMIIGDASYRAMINHPEVIDRVQYSGLANVTTDIIRELIGINDIHVGLSVYSTDGGTITDVWTDNVVLAFVDKSERANRSEFNPSFGYTFQRKGKPEIDTYFENGGKIKVIRNTDNYCIKVTASDAAYLISDTNHL